MEKRKSNVKTVSSEDSLEAQRFQLEKAKADLEIKLSEQRLLLEPERLQIERDKLVFEQLKLKMTERFLHKNIAAIVSALISLGAVCVSASQVWVAYISKDKELLVANAQKEGELANLKSQQDREWNLSLTKFIIENHDKIYAGDLKQQERVRNVLLATFPSHLTRPLFDRIQQTQKSEDAKQIWIDLSKYSALGSAIR